MDIASSSFKFANMVACGEANRVASRCDATVRAAQWPHPSNELSDSELVPS